jgi:type III restriction enzyme
MKLKEYQKQTLAVLRKYLETCRISGPSEAYKAITGQEEQKRRLGRYAQDYKALQGLPNIPYVCLRLPTGGGKTLLAARSVAVVRDAWLEKDYPTVLWLVPTNTIRRQTVEALKDTRHPYRQQLDELFEGRVRVFDIGDFRQVRPQDIRDKLTVIVGTIQTLKVANTEGRKVYAHSEDMEPHFTHVTRHMDGLENQNGSDEIKFSFANLLHLVHPIMIVDEAHSAVTGLTRDMQQRVSPSCIIEFTATPRLDSNILHSVTAQEIKDEEMIKLPIVLAEHPNWQSAVDGAIQRRQALENTAAQDSKYIRPIVLFQAQKRNEEVTVEVLKDYLVNSSGIAESKIAIATGDQRELDGINLFDPKCKIEYVITIEALKEGWDCSFAYVLCSVSRLQSSTAVEQLLGRVLRMPFAERRKEPELNRAYAHVSEPSFADAANALRDKLVHMGFDEEEAMLNIEQERREAEDLGLEGGLFGSQIGGKPTLTETIGAEPDLASLSAEDRKAVSVKKTEDGRVEVTVTGHVSDKTFAAISASVTQDRRKDFEEKAKAFKKKVAKEVSPAGRRIPFKVPKLVTAIQGELELADHEIFDEHHDWSLLDYPAKLTEDEFTVRDEAHTFEIDLDGRRLAISYASEEEQLPLEIEVEGWTENNLAIALDKLIAVPRFSQAERLKWCLTHVHHLVNERGIPLSALWRAKFVLARKLGDAIGDIRRKEAQKAYQQYLFAPDAKPTVSFDDTFTFSEHMYDGQKPYRGRFTLKKHYLEFVPAFDGGESGEEFQCAMALESNAGVKHWLRNIPKHPASFRLPLSQGWTYPDFVAELTDGRFLVVEYKGAHLLNDPDTKEKKLIGELWAKQMDGKALYLMAVKDDKGKDVRAQIVEKITGSQT